MWELWTANASSTVSACRRHCATAVLLSIVTLATSPSSAPCPSIDYRATGHADAQASTDQPVFDPSAVNLSSFLLFASLDVRTDVSPNSPTRPTGGLRTLRVILRL